jgi:hypothetical protein
MFETASALKMMPLTVATKSSLFQIGKATARAFIAVAQHLISSELAVCMPSDEHV